MPSFDIVSEIEMQDIRHGLENAQRELETRFDFRGVVAAFEWVKDEAKMVAEADFQLQQMRDILRVKLVKQNIDADSVEFADVVHSGKQFTQKVGFKQGIDAATAKKIVKHIKDAKLKVQASIQGEQVRVTGKKRDDLQAAMNFVRQADLGQPFQFTNFRD